MSGNGVSWVAGGGAGVEGKGGEGREEGEGEEVKLFGRRKMKRG